MRRRAAVASIGAAALAAALPHGGFAQARPLRFIVPYPPGGYGTMKRSGLACAKAMRGSAATNAAAPIEATAARRLTACAAGST